MKKLIISTILFIFCITNQLSSQWTQMIWWNGNMKVKSFAINGSNIFGGAYGVFLSTNEGLNWTPVNNGLTLTPGSFVYSLASSGPNTFAGVNIVYLSTNYGSSWTPVTNGMPGNSYISVLAINGNNVYAGTVSGDGIFLSTNNGSNWTAINNGLTGGTNIASIAINGNSIFIGTYTSGIYNSTDNGNNWIAFNNGIPSNSHISSIVTAGNRLFASSYNGLIYYSTNNGNVWVNTNSGFSPSLIYTLAASGSSVFVGTEGMGIFKSTNNGGAWYGVGAGILPQGGDTNAAGIHAIICDNIYAFCAPEYGNNGRGIFRRPLIELTAIKETNSEIPVKYNLSQNYPNPFNPSTIISYQLPKAGDVKLIVYDVMGRAVKSLVNGKQNAGNYQVQFDGSGLASGVYFYKLQTGDFIETKKMNLIK